MDTGPAVVLRFHGTGGTAMKAPPGCTVVDDYELLKLRRELIATRLVAYGLTFTFALYGFGARRITVLSCYVVTLLAATFLGCRWGLGDSEMSRRDALGVTLTTAGVFLYLYWVWGK